MAKTKFPLDQFTFGNSAAAIELAKRLSESKDQRLVNSVSVYLEQHNSLVKEVMTMQSSRARLSVLHLIGDRIKSYTPPWPENIVSYVKNVATMKIKKAKEQA